MKKRIYKYDNIKAFLIFLVVIGHMTTDYVSDSFLVRWTTLWIYTFHMPAFVFMSGLVHKRYVTADRLEAVPGGQTGMRWDKFWGFFLCGYGLKIFLQFTRTLMGQNPTWHWIEEPGIPWYLFVMAEYELLFYLMRRTDGKVKPGVMIAGSFVLSAVIGYFPFIGDAFCLARMINFLPFYMSSYYLDAKTFPQLIAKTKFKVTAAVILIASVTACYLGPWDMYSWRKWFTGRRSYEFLEDIFPGTFGWAWLIRLGVWAVAFAIAMSVVILMPDRDLGYITVTGGRTLNVYFWHRPLCYLFRNWAVLPKLYMLFGGTYNAAVAGQVRGHAFVTDGGPMLAAYAVYLIIGAAMTAFFALKVFEHPCKELMALGAKIAFIGKKKEQ